MVMVWDQMIEIASQGLHWLIFIFSGGICAMLQFVPP